MLLNVAIPMFGAVCHQIEEWRQALFVGFFGPVGVSAIFYLYILLHVGVIREREEAEGLHKIMTVVWFCHLQY